MPRLILNFILTASLMSWTVEAFAQLEKEERSWEEMKETFDRGCGDDQGVDRCDSATQKRMHRLYELDSPSTLLDKKVSARRAMIIDGYGNDVVAVTFTRGPGKGPFVEVKSPKITDFPAADPLQASVSEAVWNEVLRRSENFDHLLASELPRTDKDGKPVPNQRICLHAWFTVVEAIDAPRPSPNEMMGSAGDGDGAEFFETVPELPGKIRTDAESACGRGLSQAYAWELVRIAHESLPECAGLDTDKFRNLSVLLQTCSRLGGDRVAAAKAMDVVQKLNRGLWSDEDEEQAKAMEWLFSGLGGTRAASFRKDLSGGYPSFLAPRAQSISDVTVQGRIVYVDEQDRLHEYADITLTLVLEFDEYKVGDWEISERKKTPARP